MKLSKFTVAFIAVAIGVYVWKFGGLDQRNPAGLSGDTCEGRERCVSVYMAPWCPHCKSAVGDVQKMIAKSQRGGKTGVRVVIGMGQEPGDNERMAKQIAAQGVVIDDSTEIAKKLNVQGVPNFKILDKEGTVLIDGPEAYQWIAENF